MLMNRHIDKFQADEAAALPPSVSAVCGRVMFTPLSRRVAEETPELLSSLQKLKLDMQEIDFEKYIESLVRIRRNDDVLLVITDKEMHRSIIEGRFKELMAKHFGVVNVRVISQA